MDVDAAQAYLRGEVLSLRGMLYAYRGRHDEAASITDGIAELALGVGDLQAVIPALVTQMVIEIGREDDARAMEMLRVAVERRGDIDERPVGTVADLRGH